MRPKAVSHIGEPYDSSGRSFTPGIDARKTPGLPAKPTPGIAAMRSNHSPMHSTGLEPCIAIHPCNRPVLQDATPAHCDFGTGTGSLKGTCLFLRLPASPQRSGSARLSPRPTVVAVGPRRGGDRGTGKRDEVGQDIVDGGADAAAPSSGGASTRAGAAEPRLNSPGEESRPPGIDELSRFVSGRCRPAVGAFTRWCDWFRCLLGAPPRKHRRSASLRRASQMRHARSACVARTPHPSRMISLVT